MSDGKVYVFNTDYGVVALSKNTIEYLDNACDPHAWRKCFGNDRRVSKQAKAEVDKLFSCVSYLAKMDNVNTGEVRREF
jgi:hypothetical protein